MPFAADAAGLGKITVYSGLGQPLRAEVEVSATKAELSNMTARLASQDAFAQAGIEYASTLLGIRFSLDQKGGQPVIRVSSDKPINDPFVDMLLELSWPSGRLVREYTFLLDPPEMAIKGGAQVSTVEAKQPPRIETRPLAPVEEKPVARMAEEKPAKVTTSRKPKVAAEEKSVAEAMPAAEKKAAAQPVVTDGSIEVKKGDTLRKIAGETVHEGVSLEQMLVGLYRANKEAFDGGNMNRLKAGKILAVPDKESVAAVSESEARKIVFAQSSDWNAYRRKLAGAVAQEAPKDDGATQAVAGRVTAKVEDKAAPAAAPKDQVKVAKTEGPAAGKAGAGKASEEDLIAKDKALKDANERMAALEKNVSELQKLLELKNQNLADLQKQAAAKPAAPLPAAAPTKPAEAAPVEPPKPEVKPEPPKAEEAKPAEAAKPEEKPAEAAVPEAKPEPKPEPKPPVVVPPPVPVEEPSLVDELLDNLPLLGGGLVAIAGLGALAVVRRRRQAPAGEATLPPTSSLSQPSLGANSVFKSTGGQSVDTSNTPATDFSQAGPGTIDTDEVDPVAEADVYMAYGRDAQAEEILLEAMQKDPKRFAIHVKLLEIYSNRKAVKQFETLASELYAQTGGVGAEWEKAAAMGAKLDPANPLYGGNPAPAAAAADFDPDATMIVGAEQLKDTVTMPGTLSQLAEAAAEAEPLPVVEAPQEAAAEPVPDLVSLDFDLGLEAPAAPQADVAAEPEAALPGAMDFDLDLGAAEPAPAAAAESEVLDFQLPDAAPEAAPAAPADNIIDFDLDLGAGAEEPVSITAEAPGGDLDIQLDDEALPVEEAPRAFDLSSINLDLDAAPAPAAEPAASAAEPAASAADDTVVLPEVADEALSLDDLAAAAAETTLTPAADETVVMPELAMEEVTAAPAPSFDSAETVVNPELGAQLEAQLEAEQAADAEGDDARWQEVATKLDLAKAYEEMGDLEGARELLQEVLGEGNAEQQDVARTLMERVGS
ncbi:FimV/HubP family polar landmark protein [Azospira sp. I09]|uniref:FimV/HubP family polar landmark protein n=1 Tax=Azospira sp. I09 TaxID=1765049 RepID=UPI003FA49584